MLIKCLIILVCVLLVFYGINRFLMTSSKVEGFVSNQCPTTLIKKGNQILLYNPKLAKVAGVNPIVLKSLKDYKEYFLIERIKLNGLLSPSIVRLGKDILADVGGKGVKETHWNYLKNYFKNFNFKHNKIITDEVQPMGSSLHGDSIFAILKPGLILTERRTHLYEDLYPNWDIIQAKKTKHKIYDWNVGLKGKIYPYFYRFDSKKYHQEAFYHYIEKWLTQWVGYSQETVWDINCLVLDEENVVFSQENKELFKKLEKYKINPIVSPYRHRWFWDGGLHCITVDIKRKGGCERYL